MPFLPMDPAQTTGAAAAAAAAASANSGNALQQKHAEYEQTALRLSLCSDESLVSVLKKLLPRVILELMTCPPPSLPKVISIVNSCLRRVKEAPAVPVPAGELLSFLAAAEEQQLTGKKQELLEQHLKQLQLPPIRLSNLSVVRGVIPLFLSVAASRSTPEDLCSLGLQLLNNFDKWTTTSYPKMLLLLLECLTANQVIQTLRQKSSSSNRSSNSMGVRVLKALAAEKTEVLLATSAAAASSNDISRFPCYSKPSSSFLAALLAICELLLLDGGSGTTAAAADAQQKQMLQKMALRVVQSIDLTALHKREHERRRQSYRGKIGSSVCCGFVSVLGSQESASRPAENANGAPSQQTAATIAEGEGRGLPAGIVKLWENGCRMSRQELVLQQTRAVKLLTEATQAADVADEKVAESARAAAAAAAETKAALNESEEATVKGLEESTRTTTPTTTEQTEKIILPPVMLAPIILGSCAPFASISDPCTTTLTRLASASNADDELLLQLLFDLALLRPLQRLQQQRPLLLPVRTSSAIQETRGPLPTKTLQKLLQQLGKSRASAETRHSLAVLQLQWEALGLLQQALQWGNSTGQPTARFSAALSLLQWCLRLQKWFCCDVHTNTPKPRGVEELSQQQLLEHKLLCPLTARVGCLLLDFFARALEQLLLVAAPPASELLAADFMEPVATEGASAVGSSNTLSGAELLLQQFMRCSVAVFSSDAVVSPDLVYQLSQEILSPRLRPRSAAELLLQPATRELLPPLLEAVSTACRVCPFNPVPRRWEGTDVNSCKYGRCSVMLEEEHDSSWSVSFSSAVTEGMLQLLQQLLLLLPRAVEADAQQKGAKTQSQRRRAASAALSLSAVMDNPTTPSVLQALRSCGDWLAEHLGALREALQGRTEMLQEKALIQQLQQQHDYLEKQLICLIDWTFALWLNAPAATRETEAANKNAESQLPSEADEDNASPSFAVPQQLLLQEALRLATKAFPTYHPCHSFYCMICLSCTTPVSRSAHGSGKSKEISVAETATDLLQQCARREAPSFSALLHFSLPRLGFCGQKPCQTEKPSGLQQPFFSPLSVEPRVVQQELAAAANTSVEEVAEIILPLAKRLASLLHDELQLRACMGIERQQHQQTEHQQTEEEDASTRTADAASASTATVADLPLKKLRLTSKEDSRAGAESTELGLEMMRSFASLLLPLLVAKHPDEAVEASMRCTFCRCWMGLLRWQQSQPWQMGEPTTSLLSLLSVQVPVLLSSVLFAPLTLSLDATSIAANPSAAKKSGKAREAAQETREDARRAAATLLCSIASTVQQQKEKQQREVQKNADASGHDGLLKAFLPFLTGTTSGVHQLVQNELFTVRPQQLQHQSDPSDALYLRLKGQVEQHWQMPAQSHEQQQEQMHKLPAPGELAGSLVVAGCIFSAAEGGASSSARSSSGDRDVVTQAVSALLQHFSLWTTAYCGKDCAKATFSQQQSHQQQRQITDFAVYSQPWADALLLCSLESLSQALRCHSPSLLAVLLSSSEVQQQLRQEQEQGPQDQCEGRGIAAIDSLLSLLVTVSKASLRRCAAPETGMLLPAANASQRTGLLVLHSSLQSVASLASISAANACTISSSNSESKEAGWRGPYSRALKSLFETAPLVAPPLRSAGALAMVRLLLDLHRMRKATRTAQIEVAQREEGTVLSGEVKQVLLMMVELARLQQPEAFSAGKKSATGEDEKAAAAAIDAAIASAASSGIDEGLVRLVFASPYMKVSLWRRVSSSAVCWLSAVLLHAKHLPEIAAVLLPLQRVFLSRVGDADTFVGHCAWRGLSRCLLAACTPGTVTASRPSPAASEAAATNSGATAATAAHALGAKPARDVLLHELSVHVGSRMSTGPSEHVLKMQGFSVKQQQPKDSKDSEKEESKDGPWSASAELRDTDGGLARSRLLRLLLQTAKDAGHVAAVYALLDQPLPPLFVEPLCVAACDVSTPAFCLPRLRQRLLLGANNIAEDVAGPNSATIHADTGSAAVAEQLQSGSGTEGAVSRSAAEELEVMLVESQVSALMYCCPLPLLFGLSVYFWHPTAPLREVVEMLAQSTYGISSVADLTDSSASHNAFILALRQKQKQQQARLSVWQQVVKHIVKYLQGPNQLLREAACKAGADVLRRGHGWAQVEPYFADLWLSAARCMDDVFDEVRTAAATLGRALRALTVEVCCEGSPLVATVSLLQKICELHAGNKELRILCLDVLGDSVANCFAAQKRKHSRRAPNDTSRSSVSTSIETTAGTSSDSSGKGNEDWLVPLVLFLIEGLAAFEPRAFSFHQFHAEKLHGISQKDFEKTRVSLSQTGRAAKILKDIARQMDLSVVGLLLPPLLQKLRGSIGVASRCGVCFFVCWLFDEWGSKLSEESMHSKRLLKAFARSLLDPSPTVRGAAIEAFSVVCKFATAQAVQEVLEKQLLQLPPPDCLNIQEREETELGVGSALLHVSRRASELFNAKLRGAIGALAFCLRHSSNSAISEVYKDLWTEVTSSDAFGIPRYLSPIAAKLKEQLCLSQREERLTAGRAVSTIAAHVASTWKDGFSSEFADVHEVAVLKELHEEVTGRLLQGQAAFKGSAPLYIAALDASAALDGLLLLQRLSSPGNTAAAAESAKSDSACSGSAAVITKRLLRLHFEDKLTVVAHIPTWLHLVPDASRASQPFDDLLGIVHSVLQRVDGGPCGEDDSSEEDTGNKQSETLPVGSEVSRTSNQLNPREESALKAGVTALLRFIEIDLCLRLGVKCGHKPAEPAEAPEGSESSSSASAVTSTASWIRLPSALSVKGICVFTAWRGSEGDSSTSESNGHPGVKEFLNLFVRHQVISIQLKIDLLQSLSNLLSVLVNLAVCLCAVAEPQLWWAVFTRLSQHLMQQKYPRLKLAAASTAAELVRHYIHVGSARVQNGEQEKPPTKEQKAPPSDSCIQGGDTEMHYNFSPSVADLIEATGGAAAIALEATDAESPPVGTSPCQGTWSVLTLCVTPHLEKRQQQQQGEDAISEAGGRVQEMQRSLRLRLSEAQDREDACRKACAESITCKPDASH